MEMARNKLNKEINIIEIVKSWRYYERALHYLLPEKKRLDLKERTRYITIDPDKDSSIPLEKTLVDFRSKSLRRMHFTEGFHSDSGEM